MGTRGFLGFTADGKTSIAYNHYDSYPSFLGCNVLGWLRTADLAQAKVAAAALRAVDDDTPPTDEELRCLHEYLDPGVGGPTPTGRISWYQLLRHTQGDPQAMLDAGLYEDASTFPIDSLFCEWGYLVDFDARILEVYKGFQKTPHAAGRFAFLGGEESNVSEEEDRYYPVRLIAFWDFDELPHLTDDDMKDLDGGKHDLDLGLWTEVMEAARSGR